MRATVADAPPDDEEVAFLARINDYRQRNGLLPLAVSPTLTRSAKWMSGDMAATRRFDHIDTLGRDPFARMCDFGYCAQTWKAENIAAGEATGEAAFAQWRASPHHDANMLDGDLSVIGIGRAPGTADDPYGWYWTADFGGEDG